MANAAPDGNPTSAAAAVAEKLTVRESATMCASSIVPRAAQTSPTSHLPGSPAVRRLTDQPEATPTLPARYYRRKAAEARRTAKMGDYASRQGAAARAWFTSSIGWPMPLTALRKRRTRSQRLSESDNQTTRQSLCSEAGSV